MNIKSKFLLVLAIAMIGLLSSCQKKEETKVADTTEAAVKEVNLVYWSMWNETEPQAMVIKEGVKEFMSLNPGVKVEMQFNGRDIRTTLQPGIESGTQIDMWEEDIDRIIGQWQKYAAPLDEYYSNVYPTTNGKAFKDSIMGPIQDIVKTLSTDGKTYCVPYQPFVVASFYNKDHFKEAGITSTPTNWVEFLEVCQKLQDAGFTPLTIDDAYMDLPIGIHLNKMFGNTDDVEALVKDRTGKLWDDPKVLQAAKDLEALAPYMSKQVASNKWPAGQQEVATDQVSIYLLNGTWLPNEVMGTTGPDFNWGQFAYPDVTGGANTNGGIISSQGFQISKDCANKDVAFALAAHLTTGKWDQELSKKSFGAAMDKNAVWPVQVAESKVIFDSLERRMPWSGGIGADGDAFAIIKMEETALLAGTITAEEFIANIKSSLK